MKARRGVVHKINVHKMNMAQNRVRSATWGLLAGNSAVLLACSLLAGCTGYQPLEFRLNTEGRDPSRIGPAQRKAVVGVLEQLFGTPDEPKIPAGVALDQSLLSTAAGAYGSDADDSQWGLYRKYCVACHGISGDGAGPTAAVQSPSPRDFRQGIYKFTSTAAAAKPVREDLERTVRLGIPGTAMLSFAELSAGHLDALVEYVKYLSIRGETELALLAAVIDREENLPEREVIIHQWVLPAASSWTAAPDMVIVPPAAPPIDSPEQFAASIAKGRALFVTKDAQCVTCHGADGKGDGERSELYDDWNQCKKGVTPEQTAERVRLFWLPIQELPARNLTEGVFHGGNRPIDLYWRVYAGIKGTPMPAAGPASGGRGAISPDEIWHVVNYVRSLSNNRR
jgi:mono/diheme cytochrome c family protein